MVHYLRKGGADGAWAGRLEVFPFGLGFHDMDG